MKYNNGFLCDREAKVIAKDLINNHWFSACTVVYDEENDMNDYAPVDIVFTAYTDTQSAKYAIEIKERKGYEHTYTNDWMIEQKKYNTLKQYQNYGYRVTYLNIFKDGYYAMWDIDTITSAHTSTTMSIKPHTQSSYNEIPVKQERLMIDINKAFKKGYINND